MADFLYIPLDLAQNEQILAVRALIDADLSEPYSTYVYRFFLNQWPKYCILTLTPECPAESKPPVITHNGQRYFVIGCIISKVEPHREARLRGYIGMLATFSSYRGRGIAKHLVQMTIDEMKKDGCDEVMLETEVLNHAALALYTGFGFLKTKRLYRYYLNKGDAFRLILPLSDKSGLRSRFLAVS